MFVLEDSGLTHNLELQCDVADQSRSEENFYLDKCYYSEKIPRGNIIYSGTLFVPKVETEETAKEIKFVSFIPDVYGII